MVPFLYQQYRPRSVPTHTSSQYFQRVQEYSLSTAFSEIHKATQEVLLFYSISPQNVGQKPLRLSLPPSLTTYMCETKISSNFSTNVTWNTQNAEADIRFQLSSTKPHTSKRVAKKRKKEQCHSVVLEKLFFIKSYFY